VMQPIQWRDPSPLAKAKASSDTVAPPGASRSGRGFRGCTRWPQSLAVFFARWPER
jgi:hypothetical protein